MKISAISTSFLVKTKIPTWIGRVDKMIDPLWIYGEPIPPMFTFEYVLLLYSSEKLRMKNGYNYLYKIRCGGIPWGKSKD